MRIDQVEILSDAPNAVVLRHPGRKFPGVLVQGDTLHTLVTTLQAVQEQSTILPKQQAEALGEALELLTELLSHYKVVLSAHDIKVPFNEIPRG